VPRVSESLQLFTRAHANLYDFRGTYAYRPVDGGLAVEAFTGNWVGLEQRIELGVTRAFKLTFGGELQRHFKTHQTSYDQTSQALDRDDPFTVGAGYLVADVTPTHAVKLSAGARYDWYSISGGSLNPRVAAIFKPTQSDVVKLLGGAAFRAPSVYELYHADSTQRAAVNLSPERVRSGELEFSHRFTPLVVGTVSAWGNYVTNLVTQAGSGSEDDPTYYRNLDRPILTTGLDFELRRDFRDGWMIAAQTSVQRARYLSNGDHLYREVPNSPDVLGSVRGGVPILARVLTLTSRLSFIGRRWDRYDRADDPEQGHTEAALIWDLVFTGEAEHTGVRYGIGVYNAFDWRYTAPVSREFTQRSIVQQGRTLFASLSLSI
jgi:outer membrane cobalamin receptor